MSEIHELARFESMIDNAYDYAEAHINEGKPIVGIMCEYTPREIIMAAGALPICLCGGSAETIPPAEESLPANLCPLIKSTFGYHISQQNPFLEWASLIVAETTCDGKKKMYEIMAEKREMHVLELPQKPNDLNALTHWRSEILKLKEKLEQFYHVQISNEKLRQAILLMNQERDLRRQIAYTMTRSDPLLTGCQILELKSIISAIPEDLLAYQQILQKLNEQPATPSIKNHFPVRVLLTGVPTPHGADHILQLIESCDALVVAQENCSGLKPLMQNIDPDAPDLLNAIADHYFHLPCSVMTPNEERFSLIQKLVTDFKIEAIIDLTWQACLTYDIESYKLRQFADQKLNLPYLKIVTDYSPSDTERLRVRIEALIEMVRERQS